MHNNDIMSVTKIVMPRVTTLIRMDQAMNRQEQAQTQILSRYESVTVGLPGIQRATLLLKSQTMANEAILRRYDTMSRQRKTIRARLKRQYYLRRIRRIAETADSPSPVEGRPSPSRPVRLAE